MRVSRGQSETARVAQPVSKLVRHTAVKRRDVSVVTRCARRSSAFGKGSTAVRVFCAAENLAPPRLTPRPTAQKVSVALMAAPLPPCVVASLPPPTATVLALLLAVVSRLVKTPVRRVAPLRHGSEKRLLSEIGLTASEGKGVGVSDRDATIAEEVGLSSQIGSQRFFMVLFADASVEYRCCVAAFARPVLPVGALRRLVSTVAVAAVARKTSVAF